MAKGAVVRGTPVNFLGPRGDQGFGQKGLDSYGRGAGVVKDQFEGESATPGGGTPYTSQRGNPDEFMREVSHSPKGGVVLSENGMNMNDPRSNGNGVAFDGIHGGMNEPKAAAAMDSPVPAGSPIFPAEAMVAENKAHLGTGNERAVGSLLETGGVMSRGMQGTSHAGESATELLEDDVLRNLGPGGAAG